MTMEVNSKNSILIPLTGLVATASIYTFLSKRQIHPFSRINSYKCSIHSTTRTLGSQKLMQEVACHKKKEILALRKSHYCNKVSISYENSDPLMIMKGQGSRLFDENGISYLDTRNNVAHVGHENTNVVSAIQRQVAILNTNSRYLHPNATILSHKLASLLPDPLTVVFFVNSGTEANDLALRLARAYTKSKNTIVVDGAYHGHSISTLEISPYKYEHSREFNLIQHQTDDINIRTPGKHIWKVPCPDTYRGKHKGIDASEQYSNYVKNACKVYTNERNENVGAFIMEGGMSVAGVILPPPSYLEQCVKAVRDAGGVFIADEVQTGFGRLGDYFWAFQYGNSNVVPDIVTIGKPFGNGMPLAAVVTSRKISDAFEDMGVEYFNTFGGNPVSTAAGLTVIEEIQSHKLDLHAKTVGSYLKSKFLHLKQSIDIIGDVRGCGLFLGVEFVRNHSSLEPATEETSYLCSILKDSYHILTSIDGPFHNVLVIKPPLVFSMDDADYFISSFENAYQQLKNVDLKTITLTPT